MDPGPDDVLSFEAVAMGHQGSSRDTLELVLRTPEEWEAARQMVSPLGEVPEIDFDQYMVGLIGIPTESGGFIVEVASVEKTGDEITVHYVLNVPGEDCITVQALSQPHQIVIIRKDEGTVRFEHERKRYLCSMDQRR
ncbi:MAG: protease complex subunit PrcB family protein [Bacteroidetes bacterium]|nr:protease complex subunit PrcB family protein [Bacteroidota bacterium]MDA0874285.1 protease complex subunit PrcB family protein [Bacteroidota bacterium]